ncbi:hypothetical protein [Streptomyces sp. C3-3]|uniref:hypothetical protein n=1 Tax=Streptomyces sp. C3-3 TaxID=2824901 RepID=UPI001B3977EC|nr:hypothetical protein [Streptomyces sp. C3-3]MBQ1115059.1 hypothetical protein [Streptomyces sp. C3-3]
MKSPGNVGGGGGREIEGEREACGSDGDGDGGSGSGSGGVGHRGTAGRYQGIDVAPSVVADGVGVGGGRVVLAAVPVLVLVLVILVLVGAPPGPVDRPSGTSAPEAPAPPGRVVLGVGGRDGDSSGSRSDGTGDG